MDDEVDTRNKRAAGVEREMMDDLECAVAGDPVSQAFATLAELILEEEINNRFIKHALKLITLARRWVMQGREVEKLGSRDGGA